MAEFRQVALFRNRSNQAIRIPREFELEGTQAIIRKEGNRLIIEPVSKPNRLLALLDTWDAMDETLPEIEDAPVQHEDIF